LEDPASSSLVRNGPHSFKKVPMVPAWALKFIVVEKKPSMLLPPTLFEKSGLPKGDDGGDDGDDLVLLLLLLLLLLEDLLCSWSLHVLP
jgi:hypothetical protein